MSEVWNGGHFPMSQERVRHEAQTVFEQEKSRFYVSGVSEGKRLKSSFNDRQIAVAFAKLQDEAFVFAREPLEDGHFWCCFAGYYRNGEMG